LDAFDIDGMTVMSDERFWLWVDGVGGFMVCPTERVTIGQPVQDDSVEIPILADISRRHAEIVRQGETCVLSACRECRVDGRTVERSTPLRRDSTIELGTGVRLKFRQPHPLSSTARVDMLSRHRTQPSCDGIILAHETIVIGPATTAHITTRGIAQELVLFRHDGLWHCRRGNGSVTVDGVASGGRVLLQPNSRIVSGDLSVSLEPFSKKALPAAK